MVIDFFKALFIASLPIFVLTYVLVSRITQSDKLDPDSEYNESADKAIDGISKKHKEAKKTGSKANNLSEHAINKWLYFGGGFYGTMCFATYL